MIKVGKIDTTRVLVIGLLVSAASLAGAQELIEVANVANAREAVVQRAHDYKGTPYVWAGASASGVDCTGLVYCVYDDVFGVKLPRGVPNLFAAGEQIAYDDLEPGDLVFFDTVGGISHVGVYIGDGDIIHAASEGRETGVITSNLSERYYATRYVGATRMLPSAASGARIAGAGSAATGRTGTGADTTPTRYEYPRGIGSIHRRSDGTWVDTFEKDGTRYRFELEEHSRTRGFILFTDEERYVWIALYEDTGEVFWLPLDAATGSEEWTLFANVTPVE